MRRLSSSGLSKLSAADAGAVLDAIEREGEELCGRGVTPQARAAGRRQLKRAEKLRNVLFTPEQPVVHQ